MWIYPAVTIAVFGVIALAWFADKPPAGAKLLVVIGEKGIEARRGNLSSMAWSHLADIARDEEIKAAWIAVGHDGRVRFSRTFPQSSRQRVRNILLN